jgi:hypothetical protein
MLDLDRSHVSVYLAHRGCPRRFCIPSDTGPQNKSRPIYSYGFVPPSSVKRSFKSGLHSMKLKRLARAVVALMTALYARLRLRWQGLAR